MPRRRRSSARLGWRKNCTSCSIATRRHSGPGAGRGAARKGACCDRSGHGLASSSSVPSSAPSSAPAPAAAGLAASGVLPRVLPGAGRGASAWRKASARASSWLRRRGSPSTWKATGEKGCSGCSTTSRARAAARPSYPAASPAIAGTSRSSSSATSTDGGSGALSRTLRPVWLRCRCVRAASSRSRKRLRSSSRRWRSPRRGIAASRSNSTLRAGPGKRPSSRPSTQTTP